MVDSTRKIVEEFVYCLFRGDKVMPVLYFLPPSPPCRAVMLLGRMIDINFELKPVNVLEQEQLKPEFVEVNDFHLIQKVLMDRIDSISSNLFTQMNPQHCIPTIDDSGLILWER